MTANTTSSAQTLQDYLDQGAARHVVSGAGQLGNRQ
jgi:hypothetical protein